MNDRICLLLCLYKRHAPEGLAKWGVEVTAHIWKEYGIKAEITVIDS